MADEASATPQRDMSPTSPIGFSTTISMASARVELSAGDAGSQLDAIASEARIDIIVAGAYGHTRLREWIFGGVTRHLLHQSSTCTLLSH